MFRKYCHAALLITFAFAVAFGQASPAPAPSIERLREHVTHLASDKLEGRRTGTDGAKLAAEYIAREFARYGLRRSNGYDTAGMSRLEADSPNRYLQAFPYVAGVDLGKSNELSFYPANASRNQFRVSEDWLPLGMTSNDRIEKASAIFVGYGITATELNHNDYAGTDFAGKIAIALPGTPDGDNPHGQFVRYEDVRWKAIAAKNAGAKALLVVARDDIFKNDWLARLTFDNRAGDAGLPVALISRQAALILLSIANDAALADLEKAVLRISQNKLKPPPDWSLEKETVRFPNPISGSLSFSTDLVRRKVSATNVIGILDGSDPVLKKEVIVIGAHYDHLGLGGEGSLAPQESAIHHGADDNASGTAGVLELARVFSSRDMRPRRTIIFIAFGGEEEGLLGSNYYVNNPIVPLANTIAMINMDMIGRMKNRSLTIGGVGTAPEWRPMIESANSLQGVVVTATASPRSIAPRGMPMVVSANGSTIVTNDTSKQFQLTLNEDGYGPSDHSSFYSKQIPVLFFWTGNHEDYHKPTDTADKINYQDETQILKLVGQLIRDVDAAEKRPTYTVAKAASPGRSTGFRVYLGTIPNYADSDNGLLLDGVREDSPAAKAGLKAGDRIVKLAGREVRNVYDYTAALGEMKAGEEYEVELMRSNERLTLKLTPAAARR
ncbi:MAG TPA: M20/M25/M40 family metallo-hydrolase [Pyrinomonadaceae bacterium]|nr:M20/M25/M40 family metallo-hydrolase [Pyrinomonadaceae bacterium]